MSKVYEWGSYLCFVGVSYLSKKDFFSIVDDFFKQSTTIIVDSEEYIWKKYTNEYGLVKWLVIQLASLPVAVYPFEMDPEKRMIREISFMSDTSKRTKTPKIYAVDWMDYSIVREYISGKSFDPTLWKEDYVEIGRVLAKVHLDGYVLGDTKYLNFLRTQEGEYYVIDAEQAIKSEKHEYRFWDILVFLVTCIYKIMYDKRLNALDFFPDMIEGFIKGYSEETGSNEQVINVLKTVSKINYKTIIYVLLPIPYNVTFLKTVRKIIIEKQ